MRTITAAVAELIRADHREMERLFAELRSSEKRTLVAPALVALLAAHSRAEESEVYPTVREQTDKADEVAHSQEEHVEADRLAARLVDADLESSDFDKLLGKLVEAVSHHIDEEEETVLPALDQLPTDTQEELGRSFIRVRANASWRALRRCHARSSRRRRGTRASGEPRR